MTSKRHHFHLFFRQKFHFACACDLKSQSFWSSWFFLFERSSISYFFSFSSFFLSSRSLFSRQLWLSSRQRNSKFRCYQIDDRSNLFHLFRQRNEINHAVFVNKVETTMFKRIYSTSKSVANFFDHSQSLLRKTRDTNLFMNSF